MQFAKFEAFCTLPASARVGRNKEKAHCAGRESIESEWVVAQGGANHSSQHDNQGVWPLDICRNLKLLGRLSA
jgi:hypothetical protein